MTCLDIIIKWTLYFFNLLFLICGILLIILGAIILGNMGDVKSLDAAVHTQTIPILVIVLGCLIFVVSFFGCCGAKNEINWCVMIYAIFMIILLCLQIALVIVVFVKKQDYINIISTIVFDAWEEHTDSNESSMGLIEITFKCCGYNNYYDYIAAGQKVPTTCCGSLVETTICSAQYYMALPGCHEQFVDFWISNLQYVRYGGIAVAVIEFFTLIFTFVLAGSIRRSRSTRIS